MDLPYLGLPKATLPVESENSSDLAFCLLNLCVCGVFFLSASGFILPKFIADDGHGRVNVGAFV